MPRSHTKHGATTKSDDVEGDSQNSLASVGSHGESVDLANVNNSNPGPSVNKTQKRRVAGKLPQGGESEKSKRARTVLPKLTKAN